MAATEVRQVETKGTIGFTGVYETIGTPDPTPTESIVRTPITDIAKPGGLLPQTNDKGEPWFIWFGIIIISSITFLWKKQTKSKIKTIRK
ncbi:LPXTG cell wall anchor domain-containing protein [Enterococcus mundtii]|uniref:LPXTG cell wall anchor domain-containing protein n=1 Tax=Enterococcus mundtii TaxID=53346 RepID=UPI0020CF09B5|nr:LPXTG cell wall anchor domain-containing protein [Enterococcus mundtii]